MGGGKVYAVAKGRQTGLFSSWAECERQVKGFGGAVFKSFKSGGEAREFLRQHDGAPSASTAAQAPRQASGTHATSANTPRWASDEDAHLKKRSRGQYEGVLGPAGGRGAKASRQRAKKGGDQPGTAGRGSPQAYVLRFDGGSRGNPGPSGAGAVIWNASGQMIWEGWWWTGVATNNEAEFTALLRGLEQLAALGIHEAHVEGDSKLVIQIMNGRWRVHKPELAAIYDKCRLAADELRHLTFAHIRRELNSAADRAANRAMDSRRFGEEYHLQA